MMPDGWAGYVVEDLDMAILRVYGPNYNTDSSGKLMMMETKYRFAQMDTAQIRTFRTMHRLMRLGDPNRKRYLGFYVVQYTEQNWWHSDFTVNACPLTREQFHRFLALEDIGIPSLFD